MTVSVYVDVEEVYDNLSTYDKKQVAEWLYNDGIVATNPNKEKYKTTIHEDELIEKIDKIIQSYVRLTKEQIEAIEQIYYTL